MTLAPASARTEERSEEDFGPHDPTGSLLVGQAVGEMQSHAASLLHPTSSVYPLSYQAAKFVAATFSVPNALHPTTHLALTRAGS